MNHSTRLEATELLGFGLFMLFVGAFAGYFIGVDLAPSVTINTPDQAALQVTITQLAENTPNGFYYIYQQERPNSERDPVF